MSVPHEEIKQSLETIYVKTAFDWKSCPEKFRPAFKQAIMDTLNENNLSAKARKLDLDSGKIVITDDEMHIVVAFLNAYPNIKSLSLGTETVTPIGVDILSSNQTLERLIITSNKILDQGAIALSKMKLKVLCAIYCEIGDIGAHALALNNTLEKLFLNGNPITDIGVEALAKNSKIKKLELQSISIEDMDVFQFFIDNTTLLSLDLSGNENLDNTALMFLSLNRSIYHLGLRDTPIPPIGLRALLNNPVLSSLDLEGDYENIEVDKRIFLELSKAKTLLSLNLNGMDTQFYDEDALNLSFNTSLEYLDVRSTGITEQGLFALLRNRQNSMDELNNQRVALFMGRHPRLGKESRIRFLAEPLVEKILEYAEPKPPLEIEHSLGKDVERSLMLRFTPAALTQKLARRQTLEEQSDLPPGKRPKIKE